MWHSLTKWYMGEKKTLRVNASKVIKQNENNDPCKERERVTEKIVLFYSLGCLMIVGFFFS